MPVNSIGPHPSFRELYVVSNLFKPEHTLFMVIYIHPQNECVSSLSEIWMFLLTESQVTIETVNVPISRQYNYFHILEII